VAVDLRIIAATHQPIEAMVDKGEFRRDLFARLCGFTHRLPPLARRREDIGVLVSELLDRLAPGGAAAMTFTAPAAEALVRYEWPLNTRELVQALAHALALAPEKLIDIHHLPASLSEARPAAAQPIAAPDPLTPREATLRAELVSRLERREGNVSAVAREMKKAPMQIYRWMQRLGIDPGAFR
jgi:DNA-binding NtrC family response regulator